VKNGILIDSEMSNSPQSKPNPQSETKTRSSRLTLTLSSQGFGNIVWSNYENDFEFEVCDKHFFCPSLVAEFLSPHISKVRRSDCTIQNLPISTLNSSKCFEQIVSLGFGSEVCF
jgi:hypothetical protein